MALNTTGQWGSILDWPVIPIHTVMTPDGKLLTFGAMPNGAQGATMYHDVWDPVTGTHQMLDHHMQTATDIFCASAIILPGTNKVLIAGGDTRGLGTGSYNLGVDDVNFYDVTTGQISAATDGEMIRARWYPTTISLPTGQVLIMGGVDGGGAGQGTPELYTPGVGWRMLTGATDSAVAYGSTYPKVFVGGDGKVYYFTSGAAAGQQKLMQLDPSGDGSIKAVATIPFQTQDVSPAIMFDKGKVLINDSTTGLWVMDLNQATPTFTKTATLSQDRNYSNMTVMADGKVIISGGTAAGNLEAYADKTATIWDPKTGALAYTVDELNPRLYHSTAILLQDGTIFSGGGGSAGSAENQYPNAQIYKPGYLFNADGSLATRPVISGLPATINPGETFTITVDNANAIKDLTFAKTGAVTHNLNVDSRLMHLEFSVVDATHIKVTLPANANEVTAGSWMLFAWNDKGVPSIAPIVAVQPTLPDFVPDVFLSGELVVNGGFEANAMPAGASWTLIDNAASIGWKNAGDTVVENNLVNGQRMMDLDARGGVDAIYQDIPTTAGRHYKLAFEVPYATANTSRFEVLWEGKVIDTITPTAGQKFSYDLAATTAGSRLMFRELSAENSSVGAYLDSVSIREKLTSASAWYQPVFEPINILVNGDMESNRVDGTDYWKVFDNAASTGWKNASGNEVEYVRLNGGQVLDADVAGIADAIYQDVLTEKGRIYDVGFEVTRGAAGTSTVEVVWNGAVIATVNPVDGGYYHFNVTGTGANDRLMFRELASQNDFTGAYLDNIRLVATHAKDPAFATANLLVNGDMEANRITSGTFWQSFDNATSVGWKNAGASSLEYVMHTGGQAVELDAANGADAIYQDVRTEKDRIYDLSFDVPQATAGTSTFEVLWNNSVIATVEPTSGSAYTYKVTGTGGADRLTFRELAGQNDYNGAYLDNVRLTASSATDPGTDPGGHAGNHIMGTDKGEWLIGTDGADHIAAGDGWDIVYGGKGNDYLDGGTVAAGSGDYNQVNYDGRASEYTFSRNTDGTIKVAHPVYGTDTLKNMHGVYFAGEGKWYALGDLLPAIGNQTFTGTSVNDRMYGTAGNDTFSGGTGEDTFTGGKGNDVYDGGAGYDQVDLLGVATDYTVTRNADGSVSVTSAIEGTDTFKNIEGVYFHGDGSWRSIEQFAGTVAPPPPPPPPTGQTFTGTAAGEWLTGTDGNDTFDAKGGWDIVYGGKGNDIIDGGVPAAGSGDYNQVNYDGKAADYTFGRNADGTISVSHPTYGTDTLKNIQGVYFAGEAKWYPLGDLAPPAGDQTFTGTSLNDRMFGTAGNDTFNGGAGEDTFMGGIGNDIYNGGPGYTQVDYKGNSSEYHVSRNADGSYNVSHATEGTDTLRDIQGMYFWGDSTWFSVEDMANHAH